MKNINKHFSKIAHEYRGLRTTDLEPILFIKKKLKNLKEVKAADIGCGTGRYDLKLFKYLPKLNLTCIDSNQEMLNQLNKYLKKYKIKNIRAIRSVARTIPLKNNSLEVVLTFNAIHHFKFLKFLQETSRVLKSNGFLFIYTRLRSQNKRSVWGKYFPKFHEKEKRLYEISELKEVIKKVTNLKLKSIKSFKYKRTSSLKRLTTQAKEHHYSTFYLYKKEEFDKSLKQFQNNIKKNFKNPNKINWFAENTMLVIRKV